MSFCLDYLALQPTSSVNDMPVTAAAGRWRHGWKLMRADPGPDATVNGMQRAGMTTTPEPVPAR